MVGMWVLVCGKYISMQVHWYSGNVGIGIWYVYWYVYWYGEHVSTDVWYTVHVSTQVQWVQEQGTYMGM